MDRIGQDVFYARELLLTRQIRVGVDVWPDGAPLAVSSRAIYQAGTFFMGGPGPGPSVQALVRAYDMAGNELWTRQIAGETFPSQMAVDATSVYVAGYIGFGHTDLFLRKYDNQSK